MLFSAVIVSFSERARGRALNRSACFGNAFGGVGNVGMVPNTSIEDTSTLGHIVCFIGFMSIRSVLLLSRDE